MPERIDVVRHVDQIKGQLHIIRSNELDYDPSDPTPFEQYLIFLQYLLQGYKEIKSRIEKLVGINDSRIMSAINYFHCIHTEFSRLFKTPDIYQEEKFDPENNIIEIQIGDLNSKIVQITAMLDNFEASTRGDRDIVIIARPRNTARRTLF